MQRLWLIFAQTATIALAILFVVSTLKPEWINRSALLNDTPSNTQTSLPPSSVAPVSPDSYAQAAQTALPAVVHIFTSKEVAAPRHPLLNDPLFRHFFGTPEQDTPQRRSGLGSGVMVSSEGYILTNNHVIEAADNIEAALNDGRKFNARVIGRDPETDLAVLRIESKEAFKSITFAAVENVHVGDVVLAIGNPFGVGQTVTMGIVSALGRSDLGINTFENFIQTDAAINPGNSGGALIDTKGRLIGINTAIYSRSGGSLGIGFAIPASTARNIMEQIIKNGQVTRGWIGVQVQEITPDLAQAFKLPAQGALIAGIARRGPADRAGLQAGDVLLTLDGIKIPSANAVLETVAALPPGQQVKASIIRNGRTMETSIQIAQRPLPNPRATE